MMGGRVAEEMFFNEVTSGAHNDLERATELDVPITLPKGMLLRRIERDFGSSRVS
jgi:cell division protease FtsH